MRRPNLAPFLGWFALCHFAVPPKQYFTELSLGTLPAVATHTDGLPTTPVRVALDLDRSTTSLSLGHFAVTSSLIFTELFLNLVKLCE